MTPTRQTTLGIKVSKIIMVQGVSDLKYIEGYCWKTNEETKQQFENARLDDVGFRVGRICLDLIDSDQNILDTVTITQKRYNQIRGN